MNIRIVTRTIVIPLLVICFSLPNSRATAQEKVRLGHSSIGATNGSFWVADEKGLFKKHGVDVEVIR
jgi:ABC-type nitrate/sulfonate/bicarbonate transport system substrate-binding protein